MIILPVVNAVAVAASAACTGNGCLNGVASTAAIAAPAALSAEAATTTVSLSTLGVLHAVRGGATDAAINFSRESLALQGLSTYGTISALVMNASLRLFTSTNFRKEQTKVVSNTFYTSTALCIMSGAFTAILFQLLIIYSKSALGMSNDDGYRAFKEVTRGYRILGFRCFLLEMISFVVAFTARLYNTLWIDALVHRETNDKSKPTLSLPKKIIFGGSVLLILAGVYNIHSVLSLATNTIFCQPTKACI